MSHGWPLVPLGEVLRQVVDRHPVHADRTYPTFGVYGFGRGLFHKPPISGATIKAQNLYRARNRQFVYSRLKAFEGAYALVTEQFDDHYVSNEFPTFDCLNEKLLPEYLAAYFRTPSTWKHAAQLSTGLGARRERIQPEQLLTLQIPLPPLAEQRRLVARIDELAGKIEEARGLRRAAIVQAGQFISSLHHYLADGQMCRVDEFLLLDEQRENVRPGCLYPQVGVKGFGEGMFAREALGASETTYKTFNRLFEGAVVLSQVKGWEGAIAVCPKSLAGRYVSPEYRTFRCIPNKSLPEYLDALIPTPWFWMQLKHMTRGVGARRERVRPEQFLKLMIPMPSLERQKEAVPMIGRLKSAAMLREATIAGIDALLPAILDQAFQGKLP